MLEKSNQTRSPGRPKKKDSEKVIYQKIPVQYETYKKLKEVSVNEGMTFTELIENMLQNTYLV